MSNSYGFDFLRNEHLDENAQQHALAARSSSSQKKQLQSDEPGTPSTAFLSEDALAEIQNKPDLEKQFMILHFLQAHRGSGCLAPNVIYKSTGIDLSVDTSVGEMLEKNPKVKVERIPDPENPALLVATYAYQAKYSTVRDRTSLLAQINRMVSGVPMRDLLDSYPTVADDLSALITAGDVVAVANSEDKDKILFPRGEAFLVELDGTVSLPQRFLKANNNKPYGGYGSEAMVNGKGGFSSSSLQQEVVVVESDVDPTTQIRRGEAVQVGGEWFRVSSAVKAGVPLSEQPSRAQAPLSVVSLVDLPKRNEVDGYIRPLNKTMLPLDESLKRGVPNLLKARQAREKLAQVAHRARISSSGGGGTLGLMVQQALGSFAHSGNPSAAASGHAAAAAAGASSSSTNNIRRRQGHRSHAPTSAAAGGEQGPTKEELVQAATDMALASYSHARRHGCTKDIREMYLATRSLVPESDADLQAKLLEHKLLEPGEQMRRARLNKRGAGANLDKDNKPKKRRYYERKNQRMTNTHLDNTPEGAVLALALEQQKQGKSVGDGGM